jgi:hypothetical protein
MGIYYIAAFEDNTYIDDPADFAVKFPAIINPYNPFAQICMLKVYRDSVSYRMVDDIGAYYEEVIENYKNVTEYWFHEWKKIFPEWAE